MPTIAALPPSTISLTQDFFEDEVLSTTDEQTSSGLSFYKGRGVVFYIYSSDENGTAAIDIYIGGWKTIITSQSITAGLLYAIDFDYYVPQARVRFTPSAAPTTLTVKAYGYPV